MYIVFIIITAAALCIAAFLYLRTSEILKNLDKMLDSAIDWSFSEENFSETRLSKLEAKMRRYLSAGKTARGKIERERNSIKSLVSDISHQTKTPVSNILLYTELLGEKPLDAQSRKLLENIKSQSDKLNFLIQALVKISRLESGIMADEPTGNLDSKTSLDVMRLLKVTSERFSQTIVMITHNEEIAQTADRIIRIEDGRIVGGADV